MVLYKLYKMVRTFSDGRTDPANGKYFARAISLGTKGIESLAEDVSYSTTVTKADCKAVLEGLLQVMKNDLQNSYSVRLPGLGLFKVGLKTTGADSVEAFSASNNIKGYHINFLPEYTVDANTGARNTLLLAGVKAQETAKNAM